MQNGGRWLGDGEWTGRQRQRRRTVAAADSRGGGGWRQLATDEGELTVEDGWRTMDGGGLNLPLRIRIFPSELFPQ